MRRFRSPLVLVHVNWTRDESRRSGSGSRCVRLGGGGGTSAPRLFGAGTGSIGRRGRSSANRRGGRIFAGPRLSGAADGVSGGSALPELRGARVAGVCAGSHSAPWRAVPYDFGPDAAATRHDLRRRSLRWERCKRQAADSATKRRVARLGDRPGAKRAGDVNPCGTSASMGSPNTSSSDSSGHFWEGSFSIRS